MNQEARWFLDDMKKWKGWCPDDKVKRLVAIIDGLEAEIEDKKGALIDAESVECDVRAKWTQEVVEMMQDRDVWKEESKRLDEKAKKAFDDLLVIKADADRLAEGIVGAIEALESDSSALVEGTESWSRYVKAKEFLSCHESLTQSISKGEGKP